MKPRGFEFENVLTSDPKKSWFDMSYKNKFTANFGILYPFMVEETMPGDRFKISSNCFARLQPLLAPVMQNTDIFMYFFYVPNRIVWPNWKRFQSNGDGSVKMKDAASYVPPAHPYITLFQTLFNVKSSNEFFAIEYSGSKYYLCLCRTSTSNILDLEDFYGDRLKICDFFGVSFYCNDGNTPHKWLCELESTNESNTAFAVKTKLSNFAPPVGATFSTQNAPSTVEQINGLVTGSSITDLEKVNAIPFYAYQKIWNEYFRSQDYQDELPDEVIDGWNYNDVLSLRSKCFEHDYFTSILPDAQRGPDVTLSLAGSARLVNDTDNFSAHPTQVRGGTVGVGTALFKSASNNNVETEQGNAVQLDVTGHTRVDLSGVSAVTINALRYANTLQKYEELLARSGSRYNEMLQSLYGVVSSDASIQRPIFLGASRVPVSINDVAQTSDSSSQNTPLATLAGRGVAVGDCYTDFFCEENGWLIGVLSVVPRTQYYQGLNRHLRKTVNLDYPVPMFASLGEQEVYKEELICTGSTTDRDILGYLPRFSEFKYHSDEIHGELRNSLNFWTMARHLSPDPSLGAVIDGDFLRADTMDYSSFAVTDPSVDHFILDVTNTVHLERCLPEYSIPQL